MSNNKKQSSFGINIGSSSILLIFVILCLVSFAVLSIVSANADKKLSSKVMTRTDAYYNACNSAEDIIEELDSELINAYKATTDEQAYYKLTGVNRAYEISINESQHLYISLDILYPEEDNDTFYEITAWQVVNNQ
jgi:archaellum component FlaG (FlaF/FlaG flagellin family)